MEQHLKQEMDQRWPTYHWVIHNAVDKDVDKLLNHPHIQVAAAWINRGEPVAFPTETVYGLGADAASENAVRKIFQAKGRPVDNPLIVHISSLAQLGSVAGAVSPQARRLMERFWPGPLTLVLPRGDQVCESVTAGLDTVAVRMPDHPVALALIEACGKPLAAPSANRSGKPSPTQAEHVLNDLEGKIVGVLDGGTTGLGVESTVVDMTGPIPFILRPGTITWEMLQAVLDQVEMGGEGEARDQSPRSPGVKYKHYAPDGELFLISLAQGIGKMRRFIQRRIDEDRRKGYATAVITTDDGMNAYHADLILSLGQRSQLAQVAQRIYSALREADQAGAERIYAESFPVAGLGRAIMNRLSKAAQGRILEP